MSGVQILQWGECGDTFTALACVETCEYERQIIEDKELILGQIRRKNKAMKAVRLSKDIPEPVFDMNDQNRLFLVDRPSLT
ncbi:hypothetical protein N9381_05360 [Paracoccaceae bacterium]|jgi:hypothetical protein|nr:hypothetical protein [Paracoccaceae bacterium]MDB3911220.1 hypothetical protein [Paracoccaceae bacterium]HBS39883.1 hypothetical protein [Paracoccaceae bacterium]